MHLFAYDIMFDTFFSDTNSCDQSQVSNKRITYFNRTGSFGSTCTYTVNVENNNICQMR